MRFVVVLEPDTQVGGYNVSVPALPGCFTQGDSVEEGLLNARDAISTYLDGETRPSLLAAGVDPNVIIDIVDVDAAMIA